jgi:peptide/nickel transport system permease protein
MQDAAVITTAPEGAVSRPLRGRTWWLCRRQPVRVISSIILLFLMLVALAAPLIQTHDPVDVSGVGIESPSSEHWFGTDRIGLDVFSRTVAGARISLGVGFGVLLLVVPVGTLLGLLSGYIGGSFDTIT